MKPNVKIYSKKYCPFCLKAKQFFDHEGIAYEEIDITNDAEQLEALKILTKHLTVPQIFINEKFIGGYTDLIDGFSAGTIKF